MPERKNLRLENYDYSAHGAYLVTICVAGKRPMLGVIEHEAVRLSAIGDTVASYLRAIPEHCPGVRLDEHVVMPDHLHAILLLPPTERPVRLGLVVGTFKAAVSRAWPGLGLWQRGYHDRVIRDERELVALREYVAANPLRYRR